MKPTARLAGAAVASAVNVVAPSRQPVQAAPQPSAALAAAAANRGGYRLLPAARDAQPCLAAR